MLRPAEEAGYEVLKFCQELTWRGLTQRYEHFAADRRGRIVAEIIPGAKGGKNTGRGGSLGSARRNEPEDIGNLVNAKAIVP